MSIGILDLAQLPRNTLTIVASGWILLCRTICGDFYYTEEHTRIDAGQLREEAPQGLPSSELRRGSIRCSRIPKDLGSPTERVGSLGLRAFGPVFKVI